MNPSKRLRRRLRNIFDNFKNVSGRRALWSYRFLPFIIFVLFLYLVRGFFTIKHVVCTLDHEPCPVEITGKLNKYIGANVLFIHQKQIVSSIKDSFPVEDVSIGYKLFNTLQLTLSGGKPPIFARVYLVKDLPILEMDMAEGSTGSATWPRPTREIKKFTDEASSSGFGLWDNGRMTPMESTSSAVSFVMKEKPDGENIRSVYKLIKMATKYLNLEAIQIVGDRVFLSQADQPDIIVSVPFDEGVVSEAIKSFAYLSAIKKDAKVIDLRFKNPIIR